MSKSQSQSQSQSARPKQRVILVGIGGATCSGKTTLVKHLARILPNSFIIHQDDFAPPAERTPMHPTLQLEDWDAPRGAMDWPRLVAFLSGVKETGILEKHASQDHLNEQKEVPVGASVGRWRGVFEAAATKLKKKEGEVVVWGLVDGFLLYWHPDVVKQLDVRVFLRVPHDVLKRRRHERQGYDSTGIQYREEGSAWCDPPGYWEAIIYPAYVQASAGLFEGSDVEHGGGARAVAGLLLIELLEMKMDEVVERVFEVLIKEVNGDKQR
ncbi:P-loop containing nucleoside triphosphate hydrolase protein [Athelia psychrophila]|uniref:P-loop containing nucleoside triphosphate hydrolase protein n=1 Tax=Athelia psychrophila TaxID=1759441 RepID=A0A166X318_9AGAM|nr:P-loop containing nucleoside triphosphate hydrolase protein [Fibularhizoctonia sp. CBS 109695]